MPAAFIFIVYMSADWSACRLTALGPDFRLGSGGLYVHFLFYQQSPAAWALGEPQEYKRPSKNRSPFKASFHFMTTNVPMSEASHMAKPNIQWTEKCLLPILVHFEERN